MPFRSSLFLRITPIVMLFLFASSAIANKAKKTKPSIVQKPTTKPIKRKKPKVTKPGKAFPKTQPRRWSWIKMPNTKCGHGSSTGIALNPNPGAKTLIIMLQGGGACWKKSGLLGGCFSRSLAFGLDGINERYFRRSWRVKRVLRSFILQRNHPQNPFAKAHYVFVPYCTGDLHAGNATVSFGPGKTMYFHGHRNMKAYLARLVPTYKNVTRVILSGVSAGAVGAALNWNMVQSAFGPNVKVDLLSDSGHLIRPLGNLWNLWLTLWKLKVPAGCKNCRKSISQFIDHFSQTMLKRGRKAAFLLYRNDRVIRAFLGLYFSTTLFQARLSNMLHTLDQEKNANYFMITGSKHALMFRRKAHRQRSASGITLGTWMKQFAENRNEWSSHRMR